MSFGVSYFSTKVRRFIYVIGLHILALTISWWNLRRIYPDEPIDFAESALVSLMTGFISLPLSMMHLLQNLGDQAIISVSGRPLLILFECIISLSVFSGIILFVYIGSKWLRWVSTAYMLIAAPYWGYYSFALMGV